MKIHHILYLIIIALFLVSCSSRSDLKSMSRHGKVRFVKEAIYQPLLLDSVWTAEVPEGDFREIEFNEQGGITTMRIFDVMGVVFQTAVYAVEGRTTQRIVRLNSDREETGYSVLDKITHRLVVGVDYDTTDRKLNTLATLYDGALALQQNLTIHANDKVLIWNYTYDSDGNLIDEELSAENEVVSTLHYRYLEFDALGNWTKRLLFTNGDTYPDEIQTSTYEYYE